MVDRNLPFNLKRPCDGILVQHGYIAGPEVIKLFSCSTQVSMKFFLLINVKMPTIVAILTFISRKNSILGLPDPKIVAFLDIFILMSI